MNKPLIIGLLALLSGLLVTGLSFFISKKEEVRVPCVSVSGGLYSPADDRSKVSIHVKKGFPKVYYEDYSHIDTCYRPSNVDTSIPYGEGGLFRGFSKFSVVPFLRDIGISAIISLPLAYAAVRKKAS